MHKMFLSFTAWFLRWVVIIRIEDKKTNNGKRTKSPPSKKKKEFNLLHYIWPWQGAASIIHSSDCINQQIAIALAVLYKDQQ